MTEIVTGGDRDQRQLREEADRLRTTIAVQREITAVAGDRDAVLRLMAERALTVLPTGDSATVQMIDHGAGVMRVVAGVGRLVARDLPPIPMNGTLSGLAVVSGLTVRCDDTANDPRRNAKLTRSTGTGSLVVAPLRGPGGEPLGALLVASERTYAFTDADEQQLTLLADALGSALRHAEDAADRQELLQRANAAVRALERERATLARSERRFAEVFDNSPIAKVVVGLRGTDRGRVVLANPAFCQLLGYTSVEALTLTLADLTTRPPGELEESLDLLATGVQSRGMRESTLIRRDGRLLAAVSRTSAIADDEGPVSVVIQLLDITAERAAQAALARSEQQFRTAFAGSPIGLLLTDENGRIHEANQAVAALTGRTVTALIGLGPADITHPDDLPVTRDAQRRLWDTGGTVDYRKRMIRPDGASVWVRIIAATIPGPADRPWFLVQLQDITAERAAADAAARELTRLRATLTVQREVIAAAADRNATLRVVAHRAVDLFPAADGAVVELVDGAELIYTATAGTLTPFEGIRIPATGSLSGYALLADTAGHCRDTADDPRVDGETACRLGIGSMVVAPLHAERGVTGVLKVSAHRPGAFDEADEQQLALLAESLSSALRHADDTAHAAALLAERTQALSELAASENRFRLTFDNSPLGLTLSSMEPGTRGDYLHANPAMTAITGYTADELTRMNYADLQHPGDVASTAAHIERLVTGEADTVATERRYRHRDGHTVWVAIRTAVIRDPEGTARYAVNQVEDITARRTADAELRRQARLLELIPAAVIVRDLDGTIRWWNSGATTLYGWPLAAVQHQITHQLFGTGFPGGGTVAQQRAALERDGRWEGQLDHRSAHGDALTVLSRQVLHHPDSIDEGATTQVLEINTDVTAARTAERALAERNTELEAANQLKLDIIGMLGHEIGNPLTAIQGNAEILTDDWPHLTDERRGRAITAIARQAGRLDEIVREVLAMVTIESGALTAEPAHLRAREEIGHALSAVEREEVPVTGEDVEVLFHAGHLQQILVNLLSNAGKYGGGATAIHLATGPDPHTACITVEDSGPGVPEEFRGRLFDRLTRAQRDAASAKGTGLGLYIVRGLARANHGDIHYEPNPTGGSRFILTLQTAG
ncbi:PAS domain S-box protein [Actinoplanes sp. NPDC051851]|uniref:PAS domain S-box protein n=1 Tax=Actinoplanes sp. NPDC051851 TaxID=3154753 RepID=UPI00342A5928